MTPHEESVVSTCLSLPPKLSVASLSSTATGLVIQLACRQPSAACPACQQPSERIHSHYVRTIADVACGGRGVLLKLTVRKFVCRTPTCERQIFTERLTEFVQPYARMTNRLRHCLQELGIQLGALPSVRLAPQLGMPIKKASVLRLLRGVAPPVSEPVRILGVDDFCWRRGKTYGTILVDLERGVPIDLLPDRQGETLGKWLVAHPSVELISRDRGGEYAAAGRRGAPQALQTADRFHVLRNLSEALERGLHRYRAQLKAIRLPAPTKGEGRAPTVRARRADHVKRAEQARERAVERYQAVRQ